jgi:hypothetical protein
LVLLAAVDATPVMLAKKPSAVKSSMADSSVEGSKSIKPGGAADLLCDEVGLSYKLRDIPLSCWLTNGDASSMDRSEDVDVNISVWSSAPV